MMMLTVISLQCCLEFFSFCIILISVIIIFFKVEVKDIYKGVNSAFFGIHSIVEINKSVCFIYYFNDCEYRT